VDVIYVNYFKDVNMKEVLYNGEFLKETQETKDLYKKTHGLTDPGQQKERNYNWNLDKDNHVFGRKFEKEEEGAKKSLQTDYLNTNHPKTIIREKRLEDFRQANNEMLGRSKFKGALNQKLPEDHAFGLKTIGGENWNVGKN